LGSWSDTWLDAEIDQGIKDLKSIFSSNTTAR